MPRKIIVIDDNDINRMLLAKTLSKDYDVTTAENGDEAMRYINRCYKQLSAILTDINMPEMDGYELLRRVRENVLLASIPVIMVTGSDDEESRVKALSMGANDFIVKPFNPEIVKHCVKNNIALRETASILNAIQKDKLTGLLNREAFFNRVETAVRAQEAGYYMLSCFDIDNFKLINDQYGADEGDKILRNIGRTVAEDMESFGGFGARISGDNFAVLLPYDNRDFSINRIIEKDKMAFSDKLAVVFSIGRYIITDTTLYASAMYDRAFIAKQSVKGRYDCHTAYFDSAMLDKLIRSQQIVAEMDSAVASRQFEVWFQPQRNHVSGALVGAEALVRWRHPTRGMISPNEFIPVFEKNGFIYELDKYVWEECCRLLRKWIDDGKNPVPISVNVSRVDVFRTDFISTLIGLVEKYYIPVSLLRLEITESAFAQSTSLIVDIVKQLVEHGFTVEIDDFGSGYSSLNTLKCVPAQVVKLDMRFLEDDDNSVKGGNILESIVRMTKWLGMSVIAEGVEIKAQADYLASVGCSYIQGYLYARPMPTSDYEQYCDNIGKEERLLTMEAVENLDNNSFWDPKSMDTLIFNSYVGAACIFEYYNGSIELLRINAKYISILDDSGMTREDILKLDWIKCLTPESLATVRDILKRSAKTGEEYTAEYEFDDIGGKKGKTFLRSTMRAIAVAGNRMLVYCTSVNVTEQREAQQREREAAEWIENMIHDMPVGYVRMKIHDDKHLSTEYFNDTYCTMRSMTREKIMESEENDSTIPVHPDDLPLVLKTIEETIDNISTATIQYRILCGGEYRWFSVTGRKSTNKNGEKSINAYYTDINAQVMAEEMRRTLLDNLPCGAGIYRFNDGQMSLIYQNNSYWELVGLGEEAYPDPSEMSAIHPDDIPIVMNALSTALVGNGTVVCDIRLRHLTLGYRYVYLFGRITPAKEGGYYIYASFTPIPDETVSLQKMLPVAIRSIMDSSTNVAFIKDRNLRYVSASRRYVELAGFNSEEELIGKRTDEVFPASFSIEYTTPDEAVIKSRQVSVDKEILFPTPNGIRHLLFSRYPLLDGAGNVLGVYGTGHDITESMRIQSQLELLTNNIPGGIAVYEGKIDELDKIQLVYFSDGFCRLFGYTREEYRKIADTNPLNFIFYDDIAGMYKRIYALVRDGVELDYVYKAIINGVKIKYINVKAVMGEPNGDNLTVNAVFFDVTEQKLAIEQLKVSEEVNRIAINHSQNAVCRYDIATHELMLSSNVNPIFKIVDSEENIPDQPILDGRVSPETAEAYRSFYIDILQGKEHVKGLFQLKSDIGWRWVEANSTTIFSDDGRPSTAVISFADVTEKIERDMAYQKWRQSIDDKDPSSYSLFHCNITRDSILDSSEGLLMPTKPSTSPNILSVRTQEYANVSVYGEDRERFLSIIDNGVLLLYFRQGRKFISIDYREILADNKLRWLRLTVDLLEMPSSDDIEGYLMFEDIDNEKRAELEILERAETDSLTGLLNRVTFENRLARLIGKRDSQEYSALFIIDLDGFKLINDSFGHAVGDETLIELGQKLKNIFRKQDLMCRLGGDEFLVYMNNTTNLDAVRDKAALLCAILHKSFNFEIQLSASVGVAVCPVDGKDFETLYRKADIALYNVKQSGKDGYAFYEESMGEKAVLSEEIIGRIAHEPTEFVVPRHRMLIVDDDDVNREFLSAMFKDSFIIDTAAEGTAALAKLRRYGEEISVVLLDLIMPGMDGFAILKKMRESLSMQSIPVIVVSGIDERDSYLEAIKAGASDYITKPVDADILILRVTSVLSRAENERLRAKNRYLALQNDEAKRLADARKHSEELSAALQAAERADLAKGQFLSSMSHEIRTPLNAVIGYNTIALNEMTEAKTDEDRRKISMKVLDCLSKTELASRHLLTIINDVLDMSAIESGRIKVEQSPFDFRSLITSLTVMFFSMAQSKGVNFDVRFDKPTEEWFIGDQLRINQILTNLLSNAVKFTPEKGSVVMTVTEKSVDDSSADFCFTVEDTGIGMTREYLTHIWTPFEQAESSISRRFGGTGLGLSITKNLVDIMGGDITVESESGVGSRFTVKLTLKRTKQPDRPAEYDFSKINALVVDDDINTCDYIKLLFDRCGVRCTAVSSGKLGIEAFNTANLKNDPYNICLIDWKMPEMDGFTTISEIKRISTNKLPIVVVTAYDFSEVSDQAEKLGINSFISKPLFQSTLFDMLANISGKRSPIKESCKTKYNFNGVRVLLVEDNNMNMEVAKHLLSSAGMEIDIAWNGQEAYDIFAASRVGTYNAIIMDIHMPIVDGYQATRMIRSLSRADAESVPVIAMTADVFAEDIAQAHSVGMNDHIAKPIDVDVMFKTLTKYIGG